MTESKKQGQGFIDADIDKVASSGTEDLWKKAAGLMHATDPYVVLRRVLNEKKGGEDEQET